MRRQWAIGQTAAALLVAGSVGLGWLVGRHEGSSASASERQQGSATYVLQPGCTLYASVRGLHPTAAIDAMLAVGARVTVEYQRGGVVWVDSEQVGLHEDDERWGDLVGYEVLCAGDEPR